MGGLTWVLNLKVCSAAQDDVVVGLGIAWRRFAVHRRKQGCAIAQVFALAITCFGVLFWGHCGVVGWGPWSVSARLHYTCTKAYARALSMLRAQHSAGNTGAWFVGLQSVEGQLSSCMCGHACMVFVLQYAGAAKPQGCPHSFSLLLLLLRSPFFWCDCANTAVTDCFGHRARLRQLAQDKGMFRTELHTQLLSRLGAPPTGKHWKCRLSGLGARGTFAPILALVCSPCTRELRVPCARDCFGRLPIILTLVPLVLNTCT